MSIGLSNTTNEELGVIGVSGIKAAKVTACGASGWSVTDARRLLSDVATAVQGVPSSVTEYAELMIKYST